MASAFDAKKLDEAQLATFDQDYMDAETWGYVRVNVDRDFPAGEFRFLDVGGGNGKFADRLLAQYPRCSGTVLEPSELLLGKNQPDARKRLVCAAIEDAAGRIEGPFDLICLNLLLHHLVAGSYRRTQANMRTTLRLCRGWLGPRGRLSIFENIYNGRWLDSFPSRAIFHLTSSRLLAPWAGRLGANTAGVGVCFQSSRQWKHLLRDVGLRVVQYAEDSPWDPPWYQRALLQIDEIRTGHLWCKAV
ncbi:MAG: methyltransferase domain-containing protein [Proteobacteria bacterium]|nr:methyltransferase domain-containing protein [Pseudomonadota bacterium]